MKAKELSLLIVHEDKSMRQLLATFVSDRYRSVMVAAPEEVAGLMALYSFDMMIVPRIGNNAPENEASDSRMADRVTAIAAITSGLTGKIYEFRSINDDALSCVTNPFDLVLLGMAIEHSELYLRQIKRINEQKAVF